MKIFGIGLSKTGTTSLANALQILGYRVKDYPGLEHYMRGDLSTIDSSILDQFDALTDTPIPSFYRELDAKYPGSRFILTVRDTEAWLRSCKKQFNQRLADKLNDAHKALFTDLYDCTVFNEQKFASGYERFVDGVLSYFEHRPGDLLVLNVGAGEGWEKLCPFLEKPVPEIPFPMANVTRIRWMSLEKLTAIAQRAGWEIVAAYAASPGKKLRKPQLKTEVSSPLKSFARSVRYAVSSDRRRTAVKRALQAIKSELRALNPEIPILSPLEFGVSYQERHRWNHFWLVDPLESAEDLLSSEGDCAISIALIEDRRPVVGIVYAPLNDRIYYAMAGKGAYLAAAQAAPIKLERLSLLARRPTASDVVRPKPHGKKEEDAASLESKALSICSLVDGRIGTTLTIEQSMEWQTAAAQAIVEAAGISVSSCDTGNALAYNKANLENGRVVIGYV